MVKESSKIKAGDEFFVIGIESDYAFYIRKIIITQILDKGNEGKKWLFFYYKYENGSCTYKTEDDFLEMIFTKEEALKECKKFLSAPEKYLKD